MGLNVLLGTHVLSLDCRLPMAWNEGGHSRPRCSEGEHGPPTTGGTYVSQKPVARGQGAVPAALQLREEVPLVEAVELLQVPKNDAALPSQVLRQVHSFHLWKIVVDDIS